MHTIERDEHVNPPTVQMPSLWDSPMIHAYSYPLGRGRWLICGYEKTTDGYCWKFKHGGRLNSVDWPMIFARALAGLPRFGYHTEGFYSVGWHSVLMCRYLREINASAAAQILALVHDSPEVLGVGDMNSFLKKQIGHAARSYEADVLDFLLDDMAVSRFVTDDDEHLVHVTDQQFGQCEARLLGMANGLPWLASDDTHVYKFLEGKHVAAGDIHMNHTQLEWTREFVRTYNALVNAPAPTTA